MRTLLGDIDALYGYLVAFFRADHPECRFARIDGEAMLAPHSKAWVLRKPLTLQLGRLVAARGHHPHRHPVALRAMGRGQSRSEVRAPVANAHRRDERTRARVPAVARRHRLRRAVDGRVHRLRALCDLWLPLVKGFVLGLDEQGNRFHLVS